MAHAHTVVLDDQADGMNIRLEYVSNLIEYISENKLSNQKAAEYFSVSKQYIDDLFTNKWLLIPWNILIKMHDTITTPTTYVEKAKYVETNAERKHLQTYIIDGLALLDMSPHTFASKYKRGHGHINKLVNNDLQSISTAWLQSVALDISIDIALMDSKEQVSDEPIQTEIHIQTYKQAAPRVSEVIVFILLLIILTTLFVK